MLGPRVSAIAARALTKRSAPTSLGAWYLFLSFIGRRAETKAGAGNFKVCNPRRSEASSEGTTLEIITPLIWRRGKPLKAFFRERVFEREADPVVEIFRGGAG